MGTRKEITVTISEEGRDKGKRFKLTEWPAVRSEHWVLRGAFALGRAGVEIPTEVMSMGAVAILYFVGPQLLRMPSRVALKLADELMECVQIVEEKLERSLVEEDIEEIATRLKLKMEVLKLTFGFFLPAVPPTSAPAASGTEPSSR